MNILEDNGAGAWREKVWNTQQGRQLILTSVIVAALTGSGGGVLSNVIRDPAPDRFTGTEGRLLAQRVQTMEREHREFKLELSSLPPDWFEEDFRELREEMKGVHEASDAMARELIKIQHQLSSLQMRGHWSPNNLIGPGLFKKGEGG